MIDWNIMYAAWVCVEFKNIGIIFVLKDSSSSQHLHLFLIIHQFQGILFFTIVCLCLNWAVNVDMLMFVPLKFTPYKILFPHYLN
jgi:hypothetical protein